MPLYEYLCGACGRKTEVLLRFSDPDPAECPHCGGTLTKLLSSPAFQFKGSGFYATDYGKSGRKTADWSKKEEGDSSKGKEEDSSKGREGGGAPGEAGAETRSAAAGDSSTEKKDSGAGAASEGSSGKTSTAPSSPSKKDAKRK